MVFSQKNQKLQALMKRKPNDKACEVLFKADIFVQNQVFPLSNTILTPAFVTEKVSKPETQALLGDLRQPHS